MKQPVPPSTRTVLPRPGGTSPVVFALGTSRSRFGPLVAGNGFSGRLVRLIPLLAMALVLALMGELVPSLRDGKFAGGEFQAIAHGLPGGIYPVESSDDLQEWNPAGEVRLEGYQTKAVLTAAPTAPRHFYRLRSLER